MLDELQWFIEPEECEGEKILSTLPLILKLSRNVQIRDREVSFILDLGVNVSEEENDADDKAQIMIENQNQILQITLVGRSLERRAYRDLEADGTIQDSRLYRFCSKASCTEVRSPRPTSSNEDFKALVRNILTSVAFKAANAAIAGQQRLCFRESIALILFRPVAFHINCRAHLTKSIFERRDMK